MRHLESQRLTGFNETLIDEPRVFEMTTQDGRAVAYNDVTENTPVITSSYDGFCNPQLVLGSERGLLSWDETDQYAIGRIDQIHGRNMNILAGRIAITDTFGNEYRCLTIKGGDLSDPHFIETPTAARRYIVNGLQESLVLERVIKASKVLREHSVATEYICGLTLPEYFPYSKNDTGIDDKTLYELPDFLESLASKYAENADNIPEGKSALEVKAEMIGRFKDCDYMITYRAMDCPYRLCELSDPNKFKLFKEFMVGQHDGPGMKEYLDMLDAPIYIMRDLAPMLADNLAKMHKIGIVHQYPNSMNVSALGSIVDLDSCKGEILELGDEKDLDSITMLLYRMQDVRECIAGIKKTINDDELIISDQDMDNPKTYRERQIEHNLHKQKSAYYAAVFFLYTYCKEAYSDKGDQKAFLSSLLLNAVEKQSKTNGIRLTDWTNELCLAFWMIEGQNVADAPHAELPDSGTISEITKRGETFLRFLPPAFFAEIKDKLLNNSWHYEKFENEEYSRVAPTVAGTSKQVALSLLLNQYLQDDTVYDNPHAVFAAINTLNGSKSELDKYQQTIKDSYDRLYERVLETFATAQQNDPDMYLDQFIAGNAQHLKHLLGSLDLTSGHEEETKTTPIFYPQSEKDYLHIFEALGLDSSSCVNFVELDAAMIPEDTLEDTVLIVDYACTEDLSQSPEYTSVIELIGDSSFHTERGKPIIVIAGVGTPDLEVRVIRPTSPDDATAVESDTEITEQLTCQDLLETICPSQTTVRQLSLNI